MKKTKIILFFGLLSFMTFCFSNQLIAQDQTKTIKWLKTASKADKIKFWSQLSSELNKNCPMSVDSQTMVINTAPQPNGLLYNYQLTQNEHDELSKKEWDAVIALIAEEAINRFCSIPDSLFMKEANAQIRVIYFDKNGKYITEINFKAGDDCKAIKSY